MYIISLIFSYITHWYFLTSVTMLSFTRLIGSRVLSLVQSVFEQNARSLVIIFGLFIVRKKYCWTGKFGNKTNITSIVHFINHILFTTLSLVIQIILCSHVIPTIYIDCVVISSYIVPVVAWREICYSTGSWQRTVIHMRHVRICRNNYGF